MLLHISTSLPPYKVVQTKAAAELKKRMAPHPAIGRLIDTAASHSGIESRYVVIPDAEDSALNKFYSQPTGYVQPDTKTRMTEYEKWSKHLSEIAVKDLLEVTGFDPALIKRLITISCTGFFAPGLDYHLMKTFGIPCNAKRTNIGFMGCAASIIGFSSVLETINSAGYDSPGGILLLSVELCSLHLQTQPTRDNIMSNIIFADGCAAALFTSGTQNAQIKPPLQLLSTHSLLFDDSADFMGWKIGNSGFEMILSPELPKIIFSQAVPALKDILRKLNLTKDSIRSWALHPGGRAILDALQSGLSLSDEQMQPSRAILRNHGNMSSASILFVMKEILDSCPVQKDDLLCAVAFGPGLTMEVALLKGI
ncbi:MAG: type III polyketide synthase [Ignavibacteriales bacterium]